MEAFKEVKRNNWSLVYNPEFEQYRDKYKNIISVIKGVMEGGEVQGVEVKKISDYADREYFLLKINNQEFFVKKTANYNQGGVDEFKAGKEVEERLLLSGLDKVKSIKYIFAYSDNDTRYTVSEYNKDAENILGYYMARLKVDCDYVKEKALERRVEDIQTCLYDYMDLREGNMGYNPETDEITLFDLNLKKDSLIESSDDEL